MVKLVSAGCNPGSVALEFKRSEQTIRMWLRQKDLDKGQRTVSLTTKARREMRELKRENKQLWMEREILRKAAVRFARERGSISSAGMRS